MEATVSCDVRTSKPEYTGLAGLCLYAPDSHQQTSSNSTFAVFFCDSLLLLLPCAAEDVRQGNINYCELLNNNNTLQIFSLNLACGQIN